MPAAIASSPTRERARPLAPDERRAALVAATLPLLLEHGRAVTTRQIATASEVAEGTIFRVFPDKDALISATIAAALDPEPLLLELSALEREVPLPARLLAIVEILQRRLITTIALFMQVGLPGPPDPRHRAAIDQPLYRVIDELLRPDAQQFRLPLPEVARLLRLLTFSGSHPLITGGERLTPNQIVDLLMDGVRAPSAAGPQTSTEPRN